MGGGGRMLAVANGFMHHTGSSNSPDASLVGELMGSAPPSLRARVLLLLCLLCW